MVPFDAHQKISWEDDHADAAHDACRDCRDSRRWLARRARPAAQNFTKQVHIIVPYAPGGTSDILARLIGPKLSEAIGQPVIVENKPSSSGNIGADFVAKQPGDGHTLLITDVGTLATQPNLVKKLSFDVQKDLVPVGMVMFSPYLFAVHPSVAGRARSHELIAYDKANPGKLNVGTQRRRLDPASDRDRDRQEVRPQMGHRAVSRRRRRRSAPWSSNESNVIFNGALATMPFVAQNQLKGIAVSGDKRLPGVPNLPTFKELDMPIVETGSWQGFLDQQGHAAGHGGAAQRRDPQDPGDAGDRRARSSSSAATCGPARRRNSAAG